MIRLVADSIAVGVPTWPETGGGWDFSPLIWAAIAILAARFGLGLRVTARGTALALFAGFVLAMVAHRWGVLAAAGLGVLTAAIVSRRRRPEAR